MGAPPAGAGMSDPITSQKKTGDGLRQMKPKGEPIVVLTCYDYPSSLWMEEAGVDGIFCADPVGANVKQKKIVHRTGTTALKQALA